ncbi:hypothetical protein G6F35_016471 [Rhizopus arrhizus]|nr:hypothetical protein G6F35_016471 [Rhizopus arrhizus]
MAPQPALRGLYASTLLKAQLVHPVAPAVCHWRSQPVLKERIAMLKQSKRKALPWVSGQVLVIGVCLGMGAVAWASQGGRRSQGWAGPTRPGRQDAAAVLSEVCGRTTPGGRGEPARGGGCTGASRRCPGAQRYQSGRVRCGIGGCCAQLDLSSGNEER